MSHSSGPRTGRPPVYANRGMVSSPHYLASASGLNALRRGGSAIDAAIAINATLCVVYPHMAGVGGDAFWLIAGPNVKGEKGAKNIEAIEANGPSAELATRNYYLQKGCTNAIPSRGALAALTVPGAVDGWRLAHERYGKLKWETLFEDAINYALNGTAITRSLADWLVADEDILRADKRMEKTFMPTGKPEREGHVFKQPELAKTLESIAKHGARRGFYESDIAKTICSALEPQGSPLRADDFKNYHARWVTPISTSYRGYDVFQMPPSTQGFSALQILNMLEGINLSEINEGSADYYHNIVECVKLAFADRDEWLTDPRFVDIPLDDFISKRYAEKRRQLIKNDMAAPFDDIKPGIKYYEEFEQPLAAIGDTVYFCAVDSEGLTASNIQSIYHDFGACVMGGDTGVVMQNRGSFFSLDTAHPNRLEPNKHTFHTIIPAMLMKDGKPVMAYGTMGGEGQPQTQAALITRMIDYGFDVQQAIEAPRWLMGRTWGTASRDLALESTIPSEVSRELKLRGHPVKIVSEQDSIMGHAQAIRIHHDSGLYEGGADPRSDGCAMGY